MWYNQSFFSLIAYTGKNCESEIVVCRNTTCLNNGTYSSELTSDREVNKRCHCSPEYGGDLCEFKLICTLLKWISVWWCKVETKLHCWVISVNTSLAMPETSVLILYENLPSFIRITFGQSISTNTFSCTANQKCLLHLYGLYVRILSVFDQYYLYNPIKLLVVPILIIM